MTALLTEFTLYIAAIVAVMGGVLMMGVSRPTKRREPVMYPARVRTVDRRRYRQ